MSDVRPDKPEVDPLGAVEVEPGPVDPSEILSVRRGPGANCSSIGSALDLLFLSATLAGAVMVAVAASLGGEDRQDKPKEDGAEREGAEGVSDAGEG